MLKYISDFRELSCLVDISITIFILFFMWKFYIKFSNCIHFINV